MNLLTICYFIAVAVWAVSSLKENTDLTLISAVAAIVIVLMM